MFVYKCRTKGNLNKRATNPIKIIRKSYPRSMAEANGTDGVDLLANSDQTAQMTETFKWTTETRVFEEFDNGAGLPQVCKFEEDPNKGALPPGLKMYSGQPVLLHTRCRKRHIQARTIYHDANGPYYEVGQTLLIPEDFEGWYELVPPDFGRGPLCKTIAEVSSIMPRKFFTRTPILGIRIVTTEDGEQTYKERTIPAGSVLRVSGNFSAKWKTSAETGVRKKKKEEWTTLEVKYLKCLDRDEKEVLLPCTTRGKFNIVYEKGSNEVRSVFRLKDLISEFDLPLKVRLIYGKAPVVPCIFTGMLVLKSCNWEDTIIGSTVMNKRNVLFEIPVSAPCIVQTAQDEDDFQEMTSYIDGKHLCAKYALPFSTLIKLSPELDTSQQMIQHIPTAKSKDRNSSLKTLDLITNISLTDDEPTNVFMESDTDSIQSTEQAAALPSGTLMELKEIKRFSTTNC